MKEQVHFFAFSTRIKDAGIAIRHSREDIFFLYCRVQKQISGNGTGVYTHTKKQKTISKRHVFLMQKCFEDARQDDKHAPDLLESIMRPTDPVKEELRQKLFKMIQFGSKIKRMRFSKFWILEIQSFPAGGQHNLLAE